MSDARERLRAATASAHQRLERRLDLETRILDADARRAVVEGFSVAHAELEAAVAPWLSGLADLDFDARRRGPFLARDVADLGGRAPAPRVDAVQAADLPEALGLMYVAEGSTLGGRVIRKRLGAARSDMRGLSFLDPYGAEAGARWRSFLDVLAANTCAPGAAEAAVRGAVAGFRHFETRLCAEPAHG